MPVAQPHGRLQPLITRESYSFPLPCPILKGLMAPLRNDHPIYIDPPNLLSPRAVAALFLVHAVSLRPHRIKCQGLVVSDVPASPRVLTCCSHAQFNN